MALEFAAESHGPNRSPPPDSDPAEPPEPPVDKEPPEAVVLFDVTTDYGAVADGVTNCTLVCSPPFSYSHIN